MPKLEIARAWRYCRYDDRNTACTRTSGKLRAPKTMWNFVAPDGRASVAVAADANMDARTEVLVAGYEDLYLLSGASGKLIWQKPLTCHGRLAEVTPAAAIFDINRDGKPEIMVVAGTAGATTVSGIDGQMVWQHPSHGTAGMGFAVIDGDQTDVLQTDLYEGTKRIYRLRGTSGIRVWETPTRGTVRDLPVAADINGDGRQEIVFHSCSVNGSVKDECVCLNTDGGLLWSRSVEAGPGPGEDGEEADRSGAPVVVADFLGDGRLQILCVTNTALTLLDGSGEMIWQRPTGITGSGRRTVRRPEDMPGLSEPPPELAPDSLIQGAAVGDIDGDGQVEIVIGLWPEFDVDYQVHPVTGSWTVSRRKNVSEPRNALAAFSGRTGEPLWRYESTCGCPEGGGMSAPIIADIDGDGKPEVAACSSDGYVHAVRGADGSSLWQHPAGISTTGRLIFADINDDGFGEMVVSSGDKVTAVGPA